MYKRFEGKGVLSVKADYSSDSLESREYVGDFYAGKKHGKGVMTWANGDVYDGDWLDGNMTGKGKFTWANGDVYEGEFKKGEKDGAGKLTMSNGAVYEGDWEAGIYQSGDTLHVNFYSDSTEKIDTVNGQVADPREFFKVEDQDGYSNLRDSPNGEIIKKVMVTEKFEVIGSEGAWKMVKLADGTIGYIHGSRVVRVVSEKKSGWW